MPVDTFGIADMFRVTIVKHHALNPSDSWANTYELIANEAGITTNLIAAANKLTLFERNIHHSSTVFDRYIVSTWEPDSAPYDPLNFLTVTLGTLGLDTPPADPVGLTTCLHVTRNVSYGRVGHLFYRNCLGEGDVSAPSGMDILSDQPGEAVSFGLAITSSDLGELLGAPASDALGMCMINAAGDIVRNVINLVVSGVSHVKSDHKWYNRTGSP